MALPRLATPAANGGGAGDDGAGDGCTAGDGGASHPAPADGPSGGTDGLALARLRALVVDDEPDARLLVRRVLEATGAVVYVAAAAVPGLDLLRRERPDLVLSDIGMAGVDGYELLRRVRALTPEQGGRTPAVALTAFARSEDRRRALVAGFQVHVPKPVDAEELVAVVASPANVTGGAGSS